MRIEDLYVPEARTCRAADVLPDAARQMAAAEVGALAVVDDAQNLIGIISERDLVRALARERDPGSVPVEAYASSAVETATLEEDSSAVAHRMLDAGIRHLPVVEDGRVLGMLSMRDLLAFETWI